MTAKALLEKCYTHTAKIGHLSRRCMALRGLRAQSRQTIEIPKLRSQNFAVLGQLRCRFYVSEFPRKSPSSQSCTQSPPYPLRILRPLEAAIGTWDFWTSPTTAANRAKAGLR